MASRSVFRSTRKNLKSMSPSPAFVTCTSIIFFLLSSRGTRTRRRALILLPSSGPCSCSFRGREQGRQVVRVDVYPEAQILPAEYDVLDADESRFELDRPSPSYLPFKERM